MSERIDHVRELVEQGDLVSAILALCDELETVRRHRHSYDSQVNNLFTTAAHPRRGHRDIGPKQEAGER